MHVPFPWRVFWFEAAISLEITGLFKLGFDNTLPHEISSDPSFSSYAYIFISIEFCNCDHKRSVSSEKEM